MHGRQNLVVYLGLSPSGRREAHELSLQGNHVLLVANSGFEDRISVGHRSFDLGQESGRSGFASSLGVSAARASALADAIAAGGHGTRGTLAQLAQIWANAERTHMLPGRMAISGEHAGHLFWGKHGGGMLISNNIKALAAVFPLAAGAVEDLYLSACNTATDMADWPKVFPNLTTMWGYLGTAPSLATGAGSHIRLWDRATRGHQQRIDRLLAKNTGRGNNVAVWSRFSGFQTGVVESIELLTARLTAAENTFQSFFAGDSVVADHQSGPLRAYYDDIQSLLQHTDLPADQRRTWEARAEVSIRLIYFDTIRGPFQQQYGSLIATGYSAVGLAAPNFGGMDRKSALAAIAAFEAKIPPSAPAAVAQLRPVLADGLRGLGNQYIPVNWI
jgi:hypothetical protein